MLSDLLKPTRKKIAITVLIVVLGIILSIYTNSLSPPSFSQSLDDGSFTVYNKNNILFYDAASSVPIHENLIQSLNVFAFTILVLIGLPTNLIVSYLPDLLNIGGVGIFLYIINLIYIYFIATIIAKELK